MPTGNRSRDGRGRRYDGGGAGVAETATAVRLLVPDHSRRGSRLAPIRVSWITYQVFVTTMPYVTDLVIRTYAERADSENLIRELKEDLSLDMFCLQSFDATDTAFQTGCVPYNLLMGFRETVVPSCWCE